MSLRNAASRFQGAGSLASWIGYAVIASMRLSTGTFSVETSRTISRSITARTRLNVNFQEVVHSVRRVNADVARPQRFARGPNGRSPECTPDTARSRTDGPHVIDEGLSKTEAAHRFNTTAKTVAKWVARFKAGGAEGLRDRSSRPPGPPSMAERLPGNVAAPHPDLRWRLAAGARPS